MEVRHGNETLSFEEAIEQEPSRLEGEFEKMQEDGNFYSVKFYRFSYVARGQYADQLERWFKYFPKEQFLIINSDDFYSKTKIIYDQVLNFLGLPSHNIKEFKQFKSIKYSTMKPETRKKLVEFFKPHNERLYKLLGTNFHWE